MILTGSQIQEDREKGLITLNPFIKSHINPNSYNYRLGSHIKIYAGPVNNLPTFKEEAIPESGLVLIPGQVYLANTLEEIGSSTYAMSLIGKSSIGRLGLFLQVSANLGHTGSSHQWTLELVATYPIRIYPGMVIGQVSFWKNRGELQEYNGYHGNFSQITESIHAQV